MKIYIFIIPIILVHSMCYAEDSLQDKVNLLDKHSKELLGVSIYATSELIKMKGSPIFAPLNYVEESGDMAYLKELERNGYIEIKHQKGLPDGTMSDQDFVWYVRTDEGAQLLRCFEVAQHNKAFKRDAKKRRAP